MTQSITATVHNHRIELPPDVDWPDGMLVDLKPVDKKHPTVWEVLDKYDGIAADLPPDLAENIDHYVHGHPKKKK